MDVPADHRVGRQRAAAVGRHDLAGLARGVLGDAFERDVAAGLLVGHHQVAVGVMRRGAALARRLHRHRLDAAILEPAGNRHDRPPPAILALGRQVVGLGRHDHVGRAEAILVGPLAGVGELPRRRHVGQVAARRAAVDPRGDGGDVGFAQPQVVLQLLDADAVVAIGRHLAGHHLGLDRPGPRPHFLVGLQRHRADVAGTVAALAVLLQQRRDVLGEGHRRRGGRGRLREEGRDRGRQEQCDERTHRTAWNEPNTRVRPGHGLPLAAHSTPKDPACPAAWTDRLAHVFPMISPGRGASSGLAPPRPCYTHRRSTTERM